jgi:hypothetical protein
VKSRRPTHPYGFRPKRGQHDALDALVVGITTKKVNFIFDADTSWASILGCFRGSYRRHAIKGMHVNKGDPFGPNASL